MAIQGIILALEFGKPRTITSITGATEQIGWRSILAVKQIYANVQTTVLLGTDLFACGMMSNFSEDVVFSNFINSYSGKTERWAQLPSIPPPPIPYAPYPNVFNPVTPVAHAKIKVLSGGYDPLRGYWVEFLGNYWLHFPIFKDWADYVVRTGPDFLGFQASTGGGSQGNSGMGGCGCP